MPTMAATRTAATSRPARIVVKPADDDDDDEADDEADDSVGVAITVGSVGNVGVVVVAGVVVLGGDGGASVLADGGFEVAVLDPEVCLGVEGGDDVVCSVFSLFRMSNGQSS